jgi:hypothetical protein
MPIPAYIPIAFDNDIDTAPTPWSDELAGDAETSGFGMDPSFDDHDSGDDWDSFMASLDCQGSKE